MCDKTNDMNRYELGYSDFIMKVIIVISQALKQNKYHLFHGTIKIYLADGPIRFNTEAVGFLSEIQNAVVDRSYLVKA